MISALFHDYLYVPIYNLLIFLTGAIPGADIGVAVILVTIFIKVITLPLSISAVKTSRHMKLIEPQIKKIKEKYKDNKEKLAKETFALYKNNGIKPFSSILGTLIQLPVLIALYFVFSREELLHVNLDLIYSFVAIPANISPLFLDYFSITGHSVILAVVAGVVQYFLALVSIAIPEKSVDGKGSIGEDFGRSMAIQARFILPLLIMVFAYTSGAIALYFITASIVGLFQELLVRRMKQPEIKEHIFGIT